MGTLGGKGLIPTHSFKTKRLIKKQILDLLKRIWKTNQNIIISIPIPKPKKQSSWQISRKSASAVQ